MKALKNILGLFVILAIVSCKNEAAPEVVEVDQMETKAELDPNATYAKAEFNIKGMTCEVGCAKTIEKKLAGMEGVKTAKVDFETEMAMVEFDEAKVTTTSLEETVGKVSETYTVKNMRTVDTFEAKSETKHTCMKGNKNCCKDMTEAEKKACSEECKKKCCAEKEDKA